MKSILTVIFSFLFVAVGFSQTRNVVVGTNDVIVSPTNFWNANASNGRTGLGLGSAATNPASAFQSSSSVLSNLASSNGINITNIQATNLVGTIPSSNIATVNFSNVAGTLSIASGGTGATNAATARQNLGASTVGNSLFIATNAAAARSAIEALATNGDGASLTNLTAINITGTVAIAQGGTGASNIGSARTNLGLFLEVFTNTSISTFLDGLGLGWDALTNSNAATSLLGYTTSGQVVINTGTNVLTFTNDVNFASGDLQVSGTQIVGNSLSLDFEDGAVSGPLVLNTNSYIDFLGTSAATTRTNLGIPWSGLTNSNSATFQAALFGSNTNPVLVNTNGEVVSPTNFWDAAPITTTFIESQPTTNSTTNIVASRFLHIHSLATNIVNVTNIIALPTNGSTFEGDVAMVVHKGPTNSTTQVRQVGSSSNLITLNRFNEAVEFTFYNNAWQFLETFAFTDPIYFSGTNASANTAASRTNLGLGATWLTNTNVTNFRTDIGLGVTNAVTFLSLNIADVVTVGEVTLTSFGIDAAPWGGGQLDFEEMQFYGNSVNDWDFGGSGIYNSGTITFSNTTNAATTRINLGLGWSALTNTTATNFQKEIFYTNTAPSNIGGNLGTIAAWIEIVASNGVTYKIPAYTNVP